MAAAWVTAERSRPCKQPACPAIGGGSEVTFKPLVPRGGEGMSRKGEVSAGLAKSTPQNR
ncbi:hypothetical protein J6590_072179 [Homalodisca vitripennis]|nr:hypothetical protein J6590_072179 [Homalodisca vitripennis]